LAQTYAAIELVVIDDGSTDETARVASSFGSRLRYFRTENQGVYAARNFALTKVTGDYFINLDADNTLHPEFVRRTRETMQAQASPEVAFVYTQRELFGSVQSVSDFPEYDATILKFKNYLDLCSLIDLKVVRRFGFDPAFNSGYGDYDFFLALAESGYRGVLLDEPLVCYRVHTDSITGRLGSAYRQRDQMRKIVRKHRALYTRAEVQQAMQRAGERVVRSVIKARSAQMPRRDRWRALARMAGPGCAPAEFLSQFVYAISPHTPGLRKTIGGHDGKS